MRKAFDCLSHSQTIKKLEAYGFGSGSLDLMRSFFENSRNRVKLSLLTSEWKPMKRGCPQFRPLLWNMFQNDLPLHVKNDMRMTINCVWWVTNHKIVRQQLKTSSKQALKWYSNNFLSAKPAREVSIPKYQPEKNWLRYEWCSVKPGWPTHWQIRRH